MLQKLDQLKPHPINFKIYGNESVSDIVEQIKKSNWIKPLVVTQNNVIISGHRRYNACKFLGIQEVPVEVRIFNTELDEKKALLLENANREKTTKQQVAEADLWEEIEREEAKQRANESNRKTNQELLQIKNKREVENFPPPLNNENDIKSETPQEPIKPQQIPSPEALENIEQIEAKQRSSDSNKKTTPKPNEPTTQPQKPVESGKSRDAIAKHVGLGSGKNYEKAKKVVEVIKEKEAEGKEIEAKILSEILESSVDGALNIIKNNGIEKFTDDKLEKIKSGESSVKEIYKEIKKEEREERLQNSIKQQQEELEEQLKDTEFTPNKPLNEIPCKFVPKPQLPDHLKECPICGHCYNINTDSWETKKM